MLFRSDGHKDRNRDTPSGPLDGDEDPDGDEHRHEVHQAEDHQTDTAEDGDTGADHYANPDVHHHSSTGT